jgi:tetratricopeptide (TPR) repeat protein
MGAPNVAVNRLRRFIRGLATLSTRAGQDDLADGPETPADGQDRHPTPADDIGIHHAASAAGTAMLATAEPDRRLEAAEPHAEPAGEEQAQPEPSPSPVDQRLEMCLGYVRRHDWGRAQRGLDELVRLEPKGEGAAYLSEVRAIRRCQRQLARRPRDPHLHLELGRLYFGLELGDDALHEFEQAVKVEPELAEGHFYLAVEYLFRDDDAAAREACGRARELNPELPSFEDLESQLGQSQAIDQPAPGLA